ncbi:unnamed protein product [Discosporangium mesarthrocarpum]
MATTSLKDALTDAANYVLAISAKSVQAFHERCEITRVECENLHFSACRSRLPSGECIQDDILEECESMGCGLVRDFSAGVVRIPAALSDGVDGNPTNLDVVEAACYGLAVESELREQYFSAQTHGATFTYFGSWTGVFRFYPGLAYSACGGYDPRVRPWYVAASSGPKDVVIVLDISGSMSAKGRMDLAKEAVESVLGTMTPHTFVTIVVFSETARLLTGNLLLRASDENKKVLLELLNQVVPETTTNFEVALNLAFDVLDASRLAGEEYSSSCNTAILLLTDGHITQGLAAEFIPDLVQARNVDIGAEMFTFALGPEADQETTKTIACSTGGIYQAVADGGALATAMSFYYRYYAIGLGNNAYTATSDLYRFATGGDLGFTVASPAYDREFDPPAFLGVAGIDFKVQTFIDRGFTQAELEDEILIGGRECPSFNLTDCQLQVFRGSISAESVCDNSCMPAGGSLEPVRCMATEEYPTNLWQNVDLEG